MYTSVFIWLFLININILPFSYCYILDLERRFSINGVNLTSVLSPWNTMAWEHFNKLEYCIPHIVFGAVTENDLLFKRVVNYKTGMKFRLSLILILYITVMHKCIIHK